MLRIPRLSEIVPCRLPRLTWITEKEENLIQEDPNKSEFRTTLLCLLLVAIAATLGFSFSLKTSCSDKLYSLFCVSGFYLGDEQERKLVLVELEVKKRVKISFLSPTCSKPTCILASGQAEAIYLIVTIVCEYKILRFWEWDDFAGTNFCDFMKSS